MTITNWNPNYTVSPATGTNLNPYLTIPFAGGFTSSGGSSLPVAGAVLWVDGQDSTQGFQTSGGYITTWTDKSGSGYTVTATPASTLTVSTIGGYKYAVGYGNGVGVPGSGQFNVTPAIPSGVYGASGFTVFAVVNPSAIPFAFDCIYSTENPTGGDFMYLGRTGTSGVGGNVLGNEGNLFGAQTPLAANQLTSNVPAVLSYRGWPPLTNQCALEVTGEGVQLATFTSNTTGPAATLTQIGTWFNSGTYYPFLGGIAELIVYLTPLTDAQIVTVRAYLNAKYGTGT